MKAILLAMACLVLGSVSHADVCTSAFDESSLVKSLNDLADNAQVANGETLVREYNPSTFSEATARAALEQNRPDVLSSEDGSVRHSFETISGVDAVLAKLADDKDLLGDDYDSLVASIKKLRDQGVIQQILLRGTKEIVDETYLILVYIDIYVKFQSGTAVKGERVSLYYELDD